MLLLEMECPACGFRELQAMEGDGTLKLDSYLFGKVECFKCGKVFSKYPTTNAEGYLGVELIEQKEQENGS